ncbi:hypothetical protein [Bradyrhizobium elkanii]|uniref:hypothetical protein n=1 Tax=Bradyrhizobium elkanii TaxID=29448 RepID=UPI001BAA23C8|nr:hypothetical protein [Bradyrhizobium elkanii]MBR1165020.1 hypothetical protein [Bradyrhizobium elkanii]
MADADIAQLINDIYGVTRRPPRGQAPATVQSGQAVQTGYSAATNAIARYFVDGTRNALFGDPMREVDELAKAVGLRGVVC